MKEKLSRHHTPRIAQELRAADATPSDAAAAEEAVAASGGGGRIGNAKIQRSSKSRRNQGSRMRKCTRDVVESNSHSSSSDCRRAGSLFASGAAEGEAAADFSGSEASSEAANASDSSGNLSNSSRSNNSRRSSTTSCGSSSPSSGRERMVIGGRKKKRKVVVPGGSSRSSASSSDDAAPQAAHQRGQPPHKRRQQQEQQQENQPQWQEDKQQEQEERVLRNCVQSRRGAGSLVSRPAAICCGGAALCVARGEGISSNSNSSISNSSSNRSSSGIISVECGSAFDLCAFSTRSGRFLYSCRGHSAAITAVLPLPEEAASHFAAAAASVCLTASLDGTLRLWWTPAHALQEQQQFQRVTEQQQQRHLQLNSGSDVDDTPSASTAAGGLQAVCGVAAAVSREKTEKHSSNRSSGTSRQHCSSSKNELLTICLHAPIIGAAYAPVTREVFLLLQMPAEGQQQQREGEAAARGTEAAETPSTITGQTVEPNAKATTPRKKSSRNSSRIRKSSSAGCDPFSCCYGVCTLELDELLACHKSSKQLLQQTPSLLLKSVLGSHAAAAEDATRRQHKPEKEAAATAAAALSGHSLSPEKRKRLHLVSSPSAACSRSASSTSSHSSSAGVSPVLGRAAAAGALQMDFMQVGVAAVAGVREIQRAPRGRQLFRFSAYPTAFAVSSSGQYAAVACGRQVLLYSAPQDRLLVLQHDQQLVQVVLHPEDQFLAAGDIRGRIALWFGLASKRFVAAGIPASRSSNCSQQQQQEQQKRTAPALFMPKCSKETVTDEYEAFTNIGNRRVSCCCDAAAAEASAAAMRAATAAAAFSSPSSHTSLDASASITAAANHGSRSSIASATPLAAAHRPAAAAAVTAAAADMGRMCSVIWSKGNADNTLPPALFDSRKQQRQIGNARKHQRHGTVPASTVLHWHAHAVAALTFSADGLLLLSGGEEGVLVLWQVRHAFQKQFLPRLGAPILHISSCATAAAAAGGWKKQQQQQREDGDSSRWVAVSCADNSVKLVDTFYLRVGRVIQGIDIPFANFFFSPREEAAAAATAAARVAVAALAAAAAAADEEEDKCGVWTEGERTRRAVTWTEKESAAAEAAMEVDVSSSEETDVVKSSKTDCAAADRDAVAFSIAEEILLQQEQDAAAGPRCFICPLSLSPFLHAAAAASASYASFPSYASSPAAAIAAKQQLLLLQRRGIYTPWFLLRPADPPSASQTGMLQQQQRRREEEKEGTLLLGTQGSRLQIYDSRTDHHLLHLLLRPHRMYTSRINETFGHPWQTQLAAADCCCSCVAVVESRDCAAAFQGTKALEASALRRRPPNFRNSSNSSRRSTGKSSNCQRELCRLDDELIYHQQQRSFCLSFWLYQPQGKQDAAAVAAAEDTGPEPFVLRTRVEDCHVNEITALQPHPREPRFFFSLSLDTTFKAWREVVSPSPVTTEGASASTSSSFFSCILEGSFRCMQPLCCALSSDASLFIISHGRLLTLWNPASFDLLHLLPVPTAAAARRSAAASRNSAAAAVASESPRCSNRRSDGEHHSEAGNANSGREGGRNSTNSVAEAGGREMMLCSAEEKCEQLGLLEGVFGMHVVAATAAVVFIYDLLSLSLCWMKSFFHDGGSLIDFLFVEPGPGQQFGVVLAAVYPDSSSKTDTCSRRARTRSAVGAHAGSPPFATPSGGGEPVHDVRVYAFRSSNKTASGSASGTTRHPLLPLQPVFGPLEAAETAASPAVEPTAAEAATGTAEAAAESAEQEDRTAEKVQVSCVFQQIRRGADDAVVAGAFSWPLPSAAATGAAAKVEGGSQALERSQLDEMSSCRSACYEAHNSTLTLLTAGCHLDVLRVHQETVSVVEREATTATAAGKEAAMASEITRAAVAASMQETELSVAAAAAEGDIEIQMLERPALQKEDVTAARRQRPLQQLLLLQQAKKQIEKEESTPQDLQRQVPAASSLATLFYRSKSGNSSSNATVLIDRGVQQNFLLLPTEAATASHAAAPPSVLLERFIDATAERAPALSVETDGYPLAVDDSPVASGFEEDDAVAADTAAAERGRGPAPVQRASRSVLAALARRSHGQS